MELFRFINEVLSSAVDALSVCSDGDEEKASAQLLEISRKIQNDMPATKEQPAPWPGQSQF